MPSLNAAGASDLVTEYEWPNGDAIVASALSNGPTFLFVEWALALRLNRKTRRKMTQLCAARAARPRPRWYKMFCKQIWHLYVQLRHLAAPRKKETEKAEKEAKKKHDKEEREKKKKEKADAEKEAKAKTDAAAQEAGINAKKRSPMEAFNAAAFRGTALKKGKKK